MLLVLLLMCNARPILGKKHAAPTAFSDFLIDGAPLLYHVDQSKQSLEKGRAEWVGLCLNQKSGSSAWKEKMREGLEAQGSPVLHADKGVGAQQLPYSAQDLGMTPFNQTIPMYTLVRHPIARMLSGYLGKIEPRKIRMPAGYNHTTGFGGWVRWVTSQTAKHEYLINAHFRLQTHACGYAEGVRYRVLRSEEIGRWYRELVCTMQMQEAAARPNPLAHEHYSAVHTKGDNATSDDAVGKCFVATHDCGCEVNCGGSRCNESRQGTVPDAMFATFHDATAELEKYYTLETAELVNKWAEGDLVAFGYQPWYPGNQLQLAAHIPFDTSPFRKGNDIVDEKILV